MAWTRSSRYQQWYSYRLFYPKYLSLSTNAHIHNQESGKQIILAWIFYCAPCYLSIYEKARVRMQKSAAKSVRRKCEIKRTAIIINKLILLFAVRCALLSSTSTLVLLIVFIILSFSLQYLCEKHKIAYVHTFASRYGCGSNVELFYCYWALGLIQLRYGMFAQALA